MDDQFGGRTDDDLFDDDLDPVEALSASDLQPVETVEPVEKGEKGELSVPSIPTLEPDTDTSAPSLASESAKYFVQSLAQSLAQSRHAPQSRASRSRGHDPAATQPQGPPTPRGPIKPDKAGGASRLGSGAAPRVKLTDDELSAKMERMRIAAAEKTRKFEQAQRDESMHAAAYAEGMEEARKRRVADHARKRVADEDRRRLEKEREKNRARKLQAMGKKEGGWDEGKQERVQEKELTFRGANGGVRGSRGWPSESRQAGSDGQERGDDASPDKGLRERDRRRGRMRQGHGLADGNSYAAMLSRPEQAVPKVNESLVHSPTPNPAAQSRSVTHGSETAPAMSAPVGNWADDFDKVDDKVDGSVDKVETVAS